MKIIKYLSLLLVFGCGSAFASDPGATIGAIGGDSAKSFYEYIISGCEAGGWFYKDILIGLFGTFVCYEDGTATTLTIVMGLVNLISLALIVMSSINDILSYTINIAKDGEAPKAMSAWWPIRIALAAIMVMPAAGEADGNVSRAQRFIIELMKVSGGAAQYVHHKGVDSIAQASLIRPSASVSGQIVEGLEQTKLLACVNLLQELNEKQAYITVYHGFWGREKIKAEHLTQTKISSLKNYGTDLERIDFGAGGRCGTQKFAWNADSKDEDSPFASVAFSSADLRNEMKGDLAVMLTNYTIDRYAQLWPLAQALSDANRGMHSFPEGMAQGILAVDNAFDAVEMFNDDESEDALVYAKTLLKPLAESGIKLNQDVSRFISSSDAMSEWVKSAKIAGFMMMGTIYIDVSELSGLSQRYVSFSVNGAQYSAPTLCQATNALSETANYFRKDCDVRKRLLSNMDAINEIYSFATTQSDDILKNVKYETKNSKGEIVKHNINKMYKYDLTKCVSAACAKRAQSELMFSAPLEETDRFLRSETAGSVVELFGGDRQMFNYSSAMQSPSPILASKSLGNAATGAHGLAFIWMSASKMLEEAVVIMGTRALAGVFFLSYKMASEAEMLLKIAAVMFGYTIPLMPVFACIAGVFGIFKKYCYAIVAFPLAMIQMVHREGDGIAGARMERAGALLAGVVLTAPLLVIGFYASIFLGNSLFSIANTIFYSVFDIKLNSMINLYAYITTYYALIFWVSSESVKIINELPDVVLGWFSAGIGGGAFGSSGNEALAGLDTRTAHSPNWGNNLQRTQFKDEKGKTEEAGEIGADPKK